MNAYDMDQLTSWIFGRGTPQFANRAEHDRKWELCLYSCWFIWKARCKLAFENRTPNSLLRISEILKAKGEKPGQTIGVSTLAQESNNIRWMKPDQGVKKINCDGA